MEIVMKKVDFNPEFEVLEINIVGLDKKIFLGEKGFAVKRKSIQTWLGKFPELMPKEEKIKVLREKLREVMVNG